MSLLDQQCLKAIDLIHVSDDWNGAHTIVQNINSPIAQWIHAVLHKIEGDVSNSKYWYTRSSLANYDDFEIPNEELLHILHYINDLTPSK